jgi:hypothetical protein
MSNGRIQELQDRYVVQAADVACTNFFGKLFSPLEPAWVSVDTWRTPQKHTQPYPVEVIDARVVVNVTGAAAGKQGVILLLGRMKENKEVVEWLPRQPQGSVAGTGWWRPREVIDWPWGWMIKQGGCTAGDVVDFYCRYKVVKG